MSKVLYIESGGSEIIPVANGTYYTDSKKGDVSLMHKRSIFFIQFYNASMVPVVPTAGTAVPEMSPFAQQWLSASNNDTASVSALSADYEPFIFEGPALGGRVTIAGITGAVYAKA